MLTFFSSYRLKSMARIGIYSGLLFILILSCSKDNTEYEDTIRNKFLSLHDVLLGYDFYGQEDSWMNTDNLLNPYLDALIFKSNDSIDICFVGFGYGRHDLSKYYTHKKNIFSYSVNGADVKIFMEDSLIRQWRIEEITDTTVLFHQLFNDERFKLKFEIN